MLATGISCLVVMEWGCKCACPSSPARALHSATRCSLKRNSFFLHCTIISGGCCHSSCVYRGPWRALQAGDVSLLAAGGRLGAFSLLSKQVTSTYDFIKSLFIYFLNLTRLHPDWLPIHPLCSLSHPGLTENESGRCSAPCSRA